MNGGTQRYILISLLYFFSILRLLLFALLAFTATPVGREEGTLSLKKSKNYGLPVSALTLHLVRSRVA